MWACMHARTPCAIRSVPFSCACGWIAVIVFWALCVAWFYRQICIPEFLPSEVTLVIVSRCALASCLFFSWFIGLYYIVLTLTAVGRPQRSSVEARPVEYGGRVALLYTTMNDFSRGAALSCVSQDYPWTHVFLCDDSTDLTSQREVDGFHRDFPDRTTVLRRTTCHGFKAGNLNNALRQVNQAYEFFAVNDADGLLPSTFISATLAEFSDKRVGFVQCRQVAIPSKTKFGRWLDASVGIYWTKVVPYSASFGFLIFHGHGALVRTKVWESIGGFPEVVSEDLAFSTEARRCGYIGVLSESVTCWEEFPSSYRAFARRELKYCSGACEHLLRHMWAFLTAPQVTWYEKCDRLLATLVMVSPLLFWVVIISSFVLGAHMCSPTAHTEYFSTPSESLRFMMWGTIGSSFCPLLPGCLHMWRTPVRLGRYIGASVFVHLISMPSLAAGVLKTLVTGRTTFLATGDHTKERSSPIVGTCSPYSC